MLPSIFLPVIFFKIALLFSIQKKKKPLKRIFSLGLVLVVAVVVAAAAAEIEFDIYCLGVSGVIILCDCCCASWVLNCCYSADSIHRVV